VSLVVGLEGPGGIRRHWEELVVGNDQERKFRKCGQVEQLEPQNWNPAIVEQGEVYLEVVEGWRASKQ